MSTILPIRVAIVDWIKSVTGFASAKVIRMDQSMPRPTPKPSVSFRITAFDPLNHPYTTPPKVGATPITITHQDQNFTLNIACYGDGNVKTAPTVDPLEILLNLHASLHRLDPYKILTDAGIVFVDDLLGPTDTALLLDNSWEPRANMDLLMRLAWDNASDNDLSQGLIEETNIDYEIKNAGNKDIIILSDTINVDSTP